jgi:5'-3' exonuclease
MQVHLIDGTYELFRHHFPLPSHINADGQEVAATRGVVGSMFQLLEQGATHVGVATDHIVESFRNDLWPGYKTSAGMPPELLSQFPILEDALEAAGMVVFAMVEYEADDALAAAAEVAAADPRVDVAIICTADKDLGQCVRDGRIIQLDRRKNQTFDEAGVMEKFGVAPASIPDYLALVGDSADGFPGLAGWGAKSSATVLARYRHLEDIPALSADWDVPVRNAGRLAVALQDQFDLAVLFRRIATVERDAPTITSVDELEWLGPDRSFEGMCDRLEAPGLLKRAQRLAKTRTARP